VYILDYIYQISTYDTKKISCLFLFGKLFHLNGVFLNLDLLVPVTALVSLTYATAAQNCTYRMEA